MPVELCAPRIRARRSLWVSDEFVMGFALAAWGLVGVAITLMIGASQSL